MIYFTLAAVQAEASFSFKDILRALAEKLETPCIIILIILAAAAVILFGWMVGEFFSERRKLKVSLPQLLSELHKGGKPARESIESSGLLTRQKSALIELLRHPEFSETEREALAVRLSEEQQMRYDRIIKLSELVARLGPMFGLLGTLTPLGPGIIALGQGDTFTLANSLLVAFDTTIVGLISAAVATVVTTIRKTWYKNYMSVLETIAECLLEQEKKGAEE